MSLKGFHIFFIILATLLAAGCAAWAFLNETMVAFGIASTVTAAALAAYGVYFVRKSRHIIT